jgi:RHS repeat-associated protein
MSPSKCSSVNLSVSVNGNNQINVAGYSYDADGDMTADGQSNYAYDAEDEMVTANGVTYTYDGDGLRVKKSSGTLYWRSCTGQVLEETDTNGNLTSTAGRDYIFFAGRRVAWRDSSGYVYYYFADAIGNTRAVTDSSGNTCFSADYYPYGQENDYINACSPTYKFTGYEYDSETGNYYAYARYYNPRLGRFMSPDPLGGAIANPQSLNRYAYVTNNPASFTDAWGLCGGSGDYPDLPCPIGTLIVVNGGGGPGPGPGMGGGGMGGDNGCPPTFKTVLTHTLMSVAGGLNGCGPAGGGGGGGNGGGGAHGTPPQSQGPKQNRWVCAAQTADKYSVAGALGTTNKTGFWANVFNGFAGNAFSGLTLAFSGNGNKYRFATSVVNAPPPVGFAATANTINAVTTPAPISELGLTETVGSEILGEGLGYTVASLKIGYDAVSYGAALYKCW